jgi:folate/biopterin transporter
MKYFSIFIQILVFSSNLFSFALKSFTSISTSNRSYQKSLKSSNINTGSMTNSFQWNKVPLLSVYFVQGALGISKIATTYFLKDNLHLSPTEVAEIMGIISLPWVVKPLYGFISDGIPLFGYKRKSYLVLSGLVGFTSWIALGTIVDDSLGTIIALTTGSLSIAVSDVIVDSVVVEESRKPSIDNSDDFAVSDQLQHSSSAGDLQSLCWGTAAVGGILSAYFSGSLLQFLTARQIFQITGTLPLLTSLTSLFINEQKMNNTNNLDVSSLIRNLRNQILKLIETMNNPAIYLPVFFIFIWQSTPSPDSAMFYFTTSQLNFQPEFLGRVRLVASIASLMGVGVFRWKLKDTSSKSIILWSTIASTLLGLTPILLVTHYNRFLGIPDQAFSLVDTAVLTVLHQVAFMPTLVLASSLCPPGIEGTLFASLMSIYNAAGVISNEAGATLTSALNINENSYNNLPLLILTCSLSSLIPLLFISLLDSTNKMEPKID